MSMVKINTYWTPRTGTEVKKVPYHVISVDSDGIVATTILSVSNPDKDDQLWFGPESDFLKTFLPITK